MASAVLGFLSVITLTLAVKDVDGVTNSGSPVASIIRDQLGPLMERILLSVSVFAMFSCGMLIMDTEPGIPDAF